MQCATPSSMSSGSRRVLAIEFVGHACFRLWEGGRPSVVMDPYHFDETKLPDDGRRLEADTVIVSSLTDRAHGNSGLVAGSPRVINALDVATGNALGEAAELNGHPIVTIAAKEHPEHTEHDPMDNAMYAFYAGEGEAGLWVAHVGDIGYGIPNEDLGPWRGKCDLLLAIAGERNTVKLPELVRMIDHLEPKWVVPMHYALPPLAGSGGGGMTWVDAFLNAHPDLAVYVPRHHTVELPLPTAANGRPTLVVLEPSGYTPTAGLPRFTTTRPA